MNVPESDVKIEAADNGHLPYAEPTQNRVSTNEEQPSSFFDNLLNIIMKPFSLIAGNVQKSVSSRIFSSTQFSIYLERKYQVET
ncbi:hypothetical protein [Wolbachia endosymbiont (group B) of Protocalliphora azurea]|uniref:hypothetical protein n=1 Tax=Wolbachia endosymbiont (group B) of Protocalliphora azurea TaxID=2954051 RepID=UPI0022329FC6|nr:hypothetical protein [Wolbachia endosymbiont (group B) of Protocalliphora azurea]